MKKHLLHAAAVLAACCVGTMASSCRDNHPKQPVELAPDEFLIQGQLPEHKYDSACLYLVPMQGPHPRPVDSVFVGDDGKFEFRGNVEQMAVLRVTAKRRIGIQDLLVVTEPGTTTVVLDSVSSSSGTPQNEALQHWKDHIEASRTAYRTVLDIRRQYGDDSPAYVEAYGSYRHNEGEYYYDLLKGLGRQTVSIFIHKMMTGELDSLRRQELDELLKDTTDYTKPQPGFRK